MHRRRPMRRRRSQRPNARRSTRTRSRSRSTGERSTARKGELIIAAAERAGEYIPRFCYHPRMTSVGMCRMCLVEVDTGRGPPLQPSCMIPVSPDMKVDTESPTAKRAQEGMLELLLANHPLDCPVCDKGGECPLQDQAFSHGPGESRYVEEKRHYEKPIPISDLVLLDRERCILCDRCTRFADEVAGDPLIHFTQRGNQTQVDHVPRRAVRLVLLRQHRADLPGRRADRHARTASRPARGTSASRRARAPRARSAAASPCSRAATSSCATRASTATRSTGAGCATRAASTSRPSTRRQRLADAARCAASAASWNAALDRGRRGHPHDAGDEGSRGAIAVLGGARGTNEDAFAWARLADALGVATATPSSATGCRPRCSTCRGPRSTRPRRRRRSCCSAPTSRRSCRCSTSACATPPTKRTARSSSSRPTATGLSRYAWRSLRVEPGGAAAATAALVARARSPPSSRAGPVVIVAGRGQPRRVGGRGGGVAAGRLRRRRRRPARREGAAGAAPRQRRRRAAARPAPASRRPRRLGHPRRPPPPARSTCLVLLGADPLTDCPDADLARRGVAGAAVVIAVDTFLTDSSQLADVVLPAAAFGEKAGTTTNLEGRVTDGRPAGHRRPARRGPTG